MENLKNLPPFYAGQEVVAVRDHSQLAYMKGDEFVVKSIYRDCCQWLITVGKKSSAEYVTCTVCKVRRRKHSDDYEFGASGFAPKQELKMKTLTFSEVMKEQLISMN
jgi:uncharacterized protein YqfB (UPF0267 family)